MDGVWRVGWGVAVRCKTDTDLDVCAACLWDRGSGRETPQSNM